MGERDRDIFIKKAFPSPADGEQDDINAQIIAVQK